MAELVAGLAVAAEPVAVGIFFYWRFPFGIAELPTWPVVAAEPAVVAVVGTADIVTSLHACRHF